MVQIPDSAKPYVDGLVKYHFWILAAIVPFVLLPSVFSANGVLRQKIQSQKSAIDGHASALQAIQNEPDHPNTTWVESVEDRTKKLRGDILAQWELFWASQQPLRVWPPELGQDFLDFLAAIQGVEQGVQSRLPANLLQRYQNTVPDIVRKLPARMGCKDLMLEAPGGAGGGGLVGTGLTDEGDTPEASLTLDPLVWKAEDQKRLHATFDWAREPSTMQVRLAQEELWVYGLFCDVVHQLNEGATGAFNATITSVEELAVGYPAAEENPGGQGGSRVFWKSSPTAAPSLGEEGVPAMFGPGSEPVGRPSHPRFTVSGATESLPSPSSLGGSEGTEGGVGADGMPVAATSPDDPLHEWIYVDFQGTPLTAAALKSSQDATMVHLMPFTLRVVMDQRKVDQLIEVLAQNVIPIDVRQVRINPGRLGVGSGGLSAAGTGFSDASADPLSRRRRPYDVTVEVRGTVGLATPPDEKPLGGGEAAAESLPGGAE